MRCGTKFPSYDLYYRKRERERERVRMRDLLQNAPVDEVTLTICKNIFSPINGKDVSICHCHKAIVIWTRYLSKIGIRYWSEVEYVDLIGINQTIRKDYHSSTIVCRFYGNLA